MAPAVKLQAQQALRPEAAPVLKLQPRQDPFVINHEIMAKCAGYIRMNADSDGFFRGEFLIENRRGDAVEFDINCRLVYAEDIVTGVIFYYASAFTCDEDGSEIPTDFTEVELGDYLRE